jgi:hypothetical protein
MDEYEHRIENWIRANGVADGRVAKVVYAALDRPGDHGPYKAAYRGSEIVVTGPAGELVLDGSNDIQAMRMRLDEIIANG